MQSNNLAFGYSTSEALLNSGFHENVRFQFCYIPHSLSRFPSISFFLAWVTWMDKILDWWWWYQWLRLPVDRKTLN